MAVGFYLTSRHLARFAGTICHILAPIPLNATLPTTLKRHGHHYEPFEHGPAVAKTIGKVLQQARKAQGLSIYAVAEATGLTPTTISRLENRDSDDARFKTVVKIGQAVGLSPQAIANAIGLTSGESNQGATRLPSIRLYDELRRITQKLAKMSNDASSLLESIKIDFTEK